jgi:hypothetical protein
MIIHAGAPNGLDFANPMKVKGNNNPKGKDLNLSPCAAIQ